MIFQYYFIAFIWAMIILGNRLSGLITGQFYGLLIVFLCIIYYKSTKWFEQGKELRLKHKINY